MIVATAGHIDHGKTSLVRALTGIDTDRLPEEKSRGMSIDIGIAYWTPDEGCTIGFIDVPGHERFIRNMLSGVYAIDHVLLVIAADDGVMPQTREHLQIVSLLGVTQGTIVITKKDRVDAARLKDVERQAIDLLNSMEMAESPVFFVSSISGDGLTALAERLRGVASEHRQTASTEEFPRFVVDRSFSVSGAGTVARGTVVAGTIKTGVLLVVSPDGAQGRVRSLQRQGHNVEEAVAGERCAINLANVDLDQVDRGTWLVAPFAYRPTDRIDTLLRVPNSVERDLKHWTSVHLNVGAADVPARVALRNSQAIERGKEAFARLHLERPIDAVHGDRFILRSQSATQTLAGGVVLDPFPGKRYRPDRSEVLTALAASTASTALPALLAASADGAVDLDWLAAAFNRPLAAMSAHMPADATMIVAATHLVFSHRSVSALRQNVIDTVREFHRQHAQAPGIELATLHRNLARSVDRDSFESLIKRNAAAWGLVPQGTRLRAASHDSTANAYDARLWKQVRGRLEDLEVALPSVRELSAWSGIRLEQLRDLMHRKSAIGELVKITPERFALPETFDTLRDRAIEVAETSLDGFFSAADYRDRIGTGRALAIEILECLDKLGVTVRHGNSRTIRNDRRHGASHPASPPMRLRTGAQR